MIKICAFNSIFRRFSRMQVLTTRWVRNRFAREQSMSNLNYLKLLNKRIFRYFFLLLINFNDAE